MNVIELKNREGVCYAFLIRQPEASFGRSALSVFVRKIGDGSENIYVNSKKIERRYKKIFVDEGAKKSTDRDMIGARRGSF
jgi:hypothetical protein